MEAKTVNDIIFVCRNCKYANMCGDPNRTVSCKGMMLANNAEKQGEKVNEGSEL